MIYVTGDTHGTFERLGNKKPLPDGCKGLTGKDYIIIAGDFGLLWNNSKEFEKRENWWKKWLVSKPFTILFIDGNHENHDRLEMLPTAPWNGGTVGIISSNIMHLRRGEIYTIDGNKIFTFGGAVSIDKDMRIQGESWWPNEVASVKEMEYGLDNLEKNNWEVDYIITHTAPRPIVKIWDGQFGSGYYAEKIKDPTTKYLDEIANSTKFKKWYAGHLHVTQVYLSKYHLIYNDIVEIGHEVPNLESYTHGR